MESKWRCGKNDKVLTSLHRERVSTLIISAEGLTRRAPGSGPLSLPEILYASKVAGIPGTGVG